MKKFDKWNNVKKNLENKKSKIYYKEREIYWANIGENIGSEQNGKGDDFTRPLLVFKKFSNDIFFGIPLSTQVKKGTWFFEFSFKEAKISTALLVQSRLYDIKRLDKKIGKISTEDFSVLKEKFKELMNV
jgi:mRNA interferase MazF